MSSTCAFGHPSETPLHTYYFHDTHELIVARDPPTAVAFYAYRHQYMNYHYVPAGESVELIYNLSTAADVPVVGLVKIPTFDEYGVFNNYKAIEICVESTHPLCTLTEGTITEISGHAVPSGFFEELMCGTAVERDDDYIEELEADLMELPVTGPAFAEVDALYPGLDKMRRRHEALGV